MLAGGGPVYGVNTGMGALSGVALTDGQQRAHQRNLMLARAVGGPPWLPYGDVRAIFAVRLRTFLNGDAGVSAALCQRLADVLNAGLVPAVPRGGVGSAGEIIPLAHAFGPLVGIGSLLAGRPGGIRDAAGGLAAAGLGAFPLGPKEGIALHRRASRRDRAGPPPGRGRGRAAGRDDRCRGAGLRPPPGRPVTPGPPPPPAATTCWPACWPGSGR